MGRNHSCSVVGNAGGSFEKLSKYEIDDLDIRERQGYLNDGLREAYVMEWNP